MPCPPPAAGLHREHRSQLRLVRARDGWEGQELLGPLVGSPALRRERAGEPRGEVCGSLAPQGGPGAEVVVGARGCVVLGWVPGLLPRSPEGARAGRGVGGGVGRRRRARCLAVLCAVFEVGTGSWAQSPSLMSPKES